MGILDRFKKENSGDSKNPYEGLRQQALNLNPCDIGVELENNEQVYAAIVDIRVNNGLATLVCVIDGTVSLYYSNGGGMIGLGQKYEEIRHAGGSFLVSASQTIKYLDLATDFDISNDKNSAVYLLTRDGKYKAEFDLENIEKYEKHIQFINFLIQNVLTNIRESSMN